ncbi:MAG: putative lipid II flippase FtsW [Actinomycetota bacterium]|nr:putative lipid II flippase FtsW [Actinomycetota bacterium]
MAKRGAKTTLTWLVLGSTLILLFIGAVMVLNASSVVAFSKKGDSYYYFKHQLISIFIGLLAMTFFSYIDNKILRKLNLFIYLISLALLVMVLVPGVGMSGGGASRWISIKSFNFQPSEVAKLAVVIYCADIFTRNNLKKKRFQELLLILLPVAILIGLILVQPHLGTFLIISLSVFLLIFLEGVSFRNLLGLGGLGLLVIGISIAVEPYRVERLMGFLDPWKDPLDKGFHLIQSLLAFGTGSIMGVGLGMSRQKFSYLPEAHTDFIFAIIGEELGLIGTVFVVSLFLVLTISGLIIALKSRDNYSRLLGAGLASLIAVQALVNMGGVTGVMPITGVPLPFLSYGGTSIIMNLSFVGIILNIAGSLNLRNTRRTASRA